jgi:hypothetical protein
MDMLTLLIGLLVQAFLGLDRIEKNLKRVLQSEHSFSLQPFDEKGRLESLASLVEKRP